MIQIRRANARGHLDHGWLDTFHTFSFGSYFDPDYTSFRALRVMNEDRVAPGQGFGMHGHRDMEIVTYVLSGALQHKDSLGNGEILRPGEFQRMSAGTGIRHSEFNPSETEPVHLYQIWLLPNREGLQPSYEQKPLPNLGQRGVWQVVASPDGANGMLTIQTDARISLASLSVGQSIHQEIATGRHAWLQMLRGEVSLNGTLLKTSDGAAISNERQLHIVASQDAEVMLFDLA